MVKEMPLLRNFLCLVETCSNRDHAHQHQYPGTGQQKSLQQTFTSIVVDSTLFAQQAAGSWHERTYFEFVINVGGGWRCCGGRYPTCRELTRMLAREDLLWCKAVQSIATGSCPAVSGISIGVVWTELFMVLLPQLQQRAGSSVPTDGRQQPVAAVDQGGCACLDCRQFSLEALFRKLDSLRTKPLEPPNREDSGSGRP